MAREAVLSDNTKITFTVLGFVLVGLGGLCGAWVSQVADTRVNTAEIENIKKGDDRRDASIEKLVAAVQDNTAELKVLNSKLK